MAYIEFVSEILQDAAIILLALAVVNISKKR